MKIIGVAGGSGSGKTFFTQALQQTLGPQRCSVISQDNYYIDQSARFDFDGGAVNFDHPDSLDFPLLATHLQRLRQDQPIQVPVYDFKTHRRQVDTINIKPTPFILIDGILILSVPEVRALFDESVFIDTSESLRFQRRLKRDIEERGRTREGVETQFFNQVKPMHDQYVEPSKSYASFIIREDDSFPCKLKEFHLHLNAH